jgi:hypothetical protein
VLSCRGNLFRSIIGKRVVVVGANMAGAALGVEIEAYPPSNFREL